jgi:hypothetical protein
MNGDLGEEEAVHVKSMRKFQVSYCGICGPGNRETRSLGVFRI